MMEKWTKAICFAVLSLGVLAVPSQASNGTEAFEKLKGLAGHWQAVTSDTMKPTLDVELTSGGTAVIEKFHMVQEGKPVEMITMYYLDGDAVKLTHYCEAGNQPTMRGSYAPDTKTLTFELSGVTNLKTPDDGYMYHAVYTFVDSDHVKMLWTFRKNQKDAFTEDTTYVRTK